MEVAQRLLASSIFARRRSSCARASGVNSSPKSSDSKIGRISTSDPPSNGARFNQWTASSIDSALARFFKEVGLKTSVAMKHEDGRTSVRVKLDFSKEPEDRGSHWLSGIARLRDGVSVSAANAEIKAIGVQLTRLPDRGPVHAPILRRESTKLGAGEAPTELEPA